MSIHAIQEGYRGVRTRDAHQYRKASKTILFRKRIKSQNRFKKATETHVPISALKVKLKTERRD